jgi:hypothetical protein
MKFSSIIYTIILGIIGFCTTISFIAFQSISQTENSILFSNNPYFVLWATIISITIALSIAVLPYIYILLKSILLNTSHRLFIGLAILSSILMPIIFVVTSYFNANIIVSGVALLQSNLLLFKSPELTLNIIILIMFIPNFMCLHGNLMINWNLTKLSDSQSAEKVRQLYKNYSTLLIIVSISMVLGVVSLSLLRLSFVEMLPEHIASEFPEQFILAYALTMSFFVILFYLPTEIHFSQIFKSESFQKDSHGITKEQSVFKIALSMLSPMIIGVIMELLGKI